MEKLVICRMNQDFIGFMRKNYSEVANKQSKFGILTKAEDNEEKEDE